MSLFFSQTFLSGVVAIGCFIYFNKRSKLTRLIGMLFSLSCIFNLLQYFSLTWFAGAAYVNIIGSVYDIVFLATAGIIYNLATQSKFRNLIFTLSALFILGAIINVLFIQKSSITSYSKFASSLIVIVYSVMYFYRLMVDLPTTHLHRMAMFWINSAFLLYSAGTVFLFAFINYLISQQAENFSKYWSLNLFLFMAQQLLILTGLFYDIRNILAPSRPQNT